MLPLTRIFFVLLIVSTILLDKQFAQCGKSNESNENGGKNKSAEISPKKSYAFVAKQPPSSPAGSSNRVGGELKGEEGGSSSGIGRLPSSGEGRRNGAASGENVERLERQQQNSADYVFKVDRDEIIILALDFYEHPPLEVQKAQTHEIAFQKIKEHIYGKYLRRNVPKDYVLTIAQRTEMNGTIKKVLSEIEKGKHAEYKEKSMNFMDEDKLRELFKFVSKRSKDQNPAQMHKQIFGLYLAMNNLSIHSGSQGRKFEYKLTRAQRYHLNGFIQKLFYDHFDAKKETVVFRKSRWNNYKRLPNMVDKEEPEQKGACDINKELLNKLMNNLIEKETNRLRRTNHKFSALFELIFGLYLSQRGCVSESMSKSEIDALDVAILESMFEGTEIIDENKLRKTIGTRLMNDQPLYAKVREGNIEKFIGKFFGIYIGKNKLVRAEMPKKLIWWLESLIYEILYENVDPKLNLDFGSNIVKEAQNAVNAAIRSQEETTEQLQRCDWWWWNPAPAASIVSPALFYAVDQSTAPITFFDAQLHPNAQQYFAVNFPPIQVPSNQPQMLAMGAAYQQTMPQPALDYYSPTHRGGTGVFIPPIGMERQQRRREQAETPTGSRFHALGDHTDMDARYSESDNERSNEDVESRKSYAAVLMQEQPKTPIQQQQEAATEENVELEEEPMEGEERNENREKEEESQPKKSWADMAEEGDERIEEEKERGKAIEIEETKFEAPPTPKEWKQSFASIVLNSPKNEKTNEHKETAPLSSSSPAATSVHHQTKNEHGKKEEIGETEAKTTSPHEAKTTSHSHPEKQKYKIPVKTKEKGILGRGPAGAASSIHRSPKKTGRK